jgi:hypothetical protein
MTERDLHSLKDMATPAPRTEAKVRAMSIGMASFDAAQKEWPESFQVPTQGSAKPERPTNVTSLKKERSWMRRIPNVNPGAYAAIAASIIAMVAAAPFLLRAFDVRPAPVPQVAQVPAAQTSAKVALADQVAKQASARFDDSRRFARAFDWVSGRQSHHRRICVDDVYSLCQVP